MDAYITASRSYYIAVEDTAGPHCTVKFFPRQPEAAVDAAQRWQTNHPVAVVNVDTRLIPYVLSRTLSPAIGASLSPLLDAAARGAAERHFHSRYAPH